MVDRDAVDAHVERWRAVLPDLDPVAEGVVVRIEHLAKHLHRAKEKALADHDLQAFEYATLHALAGRGGTATPTEIATDLRISPAAMSGRLDTLHRRGFIAREVSPTDRRKVDVALTDAGRAAWRSALDVQGAAEERMLAVLTPAERGRLAALLRRVLLAADADGR
ncbi:MarR family winged helix-turn-helix transcriptional regulator [Saccharothrix syringae]|uniref:MarR family transcriptional regulator n=1 Tax=Saccharothrix syringae TaxID=103733 RepID=A0A5Q0H5F2_SACSY|nr:MarR family transcriptional regulator [Saccharothrix syringae]QFZ20982.1 MarR family transcriptional regulator [Saccharothrix syringae]